MMMLWQTWRVKYREKRWLRVIVQGILLLLIYFSAQAWLKRDLIEGGLPHFSGVTLQGDPIRWGGEQEQSMLLYVWATWCPTCAMQRPTIEKLAQEHHVVTIASQSGPAAYVQTYVQEHDIHAPIVVDESGTLLSTLGVRGFPTLLIVDRQGIVRFRERGLTSRWGLLLRLWWADHF